MRHNEEYVEFSPLRYIYTIFVIALFFILFVNCGHQGQRKKVFISSLIKLHNNNTSKKGKVKVYNTNVINIYCLLMPLINFLNWKAGNQRVFRSSVSFPEK